MSTQTGQNALLQGNNESLYPQQQVVAQQQVPIYPNQQNVAIQSQNAAPIQNIQQQQQQQSRCICQHQCIQPQINAQYQVQNYPNYSFQDEVKRQQNYQQHKQIFGCLIIIGLCCLILEVISLYFIQQFMLELLENFSKYENRTAQEPLFSRDQLEMLIHDAF